MVSYKHRRPHRIRKKKSIFRSRFFGITLLILFFSGAIFYFLFFSPILQLKEVKISGNKKIQNQGVESILREKISQKLLFFMTKSIFLVNSKEIAKSLLENYPQIEQINLKRKLPATLIVEIRERFPVAIFCQACLSFPSENFGGQEEDCFFVDKTGVIFEDGPKDGEEDKSSSSPFAAARDYDLIIKFQNEKKEVFLGQKIIQEEKLISILEIQEKLKTNLKIISKEFIIQNGDRVNVKTTEGWEIYFDLKNSFDWQITKLSLVLEKEIPLEKRGNLEYIDLRFGNFAPYKYRRLPQSPSD